MRVRQRVDLLELLGRERRARQRREVLVELLRTRGADERRGDHRVAQHPLDRHLRERLPALLRDDVEAAQGREPLVGQSGRSRQRRALLRALGAAVAEVLVGQQPLRERREGDRAHALLLEHTGQAVLDPAVEDRVRRLVDHERRAEAACHGCGDRRALGAVRRDADVQRLALAHEGVEGADGLLDRRHGVDAVRVEDVDVVDAHALQRLLGARQDVLARSEVAVRAGPHVVARLRRDDELVAVRREVLAHHAPEVRLGRAVRRAVVVREVEVRDARCRTRGAAPRAGCRTGCCRRSSTTGRARSAAGTVRTRRPGGTRVEA